jgi:hypothetical protein
MGERAIAAVSETLQRIVGETLMEEAALLDSAEHVVLSSPAEMPHDRRTRVGIFLHQVSEHALSRPQAMQIRGPLGFSLSYMIFPVGPDAALCQHILGRLLRTLYDHTTLQVPEAGGEVDLALATYSLDQMLSLWSALDTPYSCALYYVVRIVRLPDLQ